MNIANANSVQAIATQMLHAIQSATEAFLPECTRVRVSPPDTSISSTIQMLGPRLFLGRWPATRVSILSSRLPKRKDSVPWWFDALRTVAIRSEADGATLVCVPGTTAAEFTARLCELMQLRCLRFNLPDKESIAPESIPEWLSVSSPVDEEIVVSPRIELPDCLPAAGLSSLPLQDRILAFCGSRLVSLHTTANGSCHQLLHNQLVAGKPVMLAALRGRRNELGTNPELVADGAIPWILEPLSTKAEYRSEALYRTATPMHSPLSYPSEWLCHWTRPHHGPGADQSRNDYIDELLLSSQSADRSALASLIRIVENQGIDTASLSLEAEAVSWTAVPLKEFRSRRIFRPHKQHFDFEPWGIAVRRQWLKKDGCQPVQYVTDQAEELPCEAWLRQPAVSRNGRVDWREEHEWRSPRRVDLAAAPPNDVVVFVDQLSQVPGRLMELVQQHGWTILAVPDPVETDKT